MVTTKSTPSPKTTSAPTETEIRAALAKLQAKRDAQRAKRQTPEFKEKAKARRVAKLERVKALIEAGKKLGIELK
jgi:hypothetical protein